MGGWRFADGGGSNEWDFAKELLCLNLLAFAAFIGHTAVCILNCCFKAFLAGFCNLRHNNEEHLMHFLEKNLMNFVQV